MSHDAERNTRRPRVLVVDDDPSIRSLVRCGLLDEGFDVSEAMDGAQALEHLQRDSFGAIVLDLEMPEIDGRTFYRLMREQGLRVPTVILSAYGGRRAARELGAESALEKPFDIDHLMTLVHRVVGGEQTRPAHGNALDTAAPVDSSCST